LKLQIQDLNCARESADGIAERSRKDEQKIVA
jgi:hypothetical protein